MNRQPFLPQYKNASYGVGPKALEQRSAFISCIGRCLALWPYVEHQLAMILGLLMKADNAATIAVFSAIRTGRTQRDALIATASIALPPDRLRLVRAALSVVDAVGGERADIAHGVWGIMDEHQDRILWIEAKHHSPWNTLVITKEMKGEHLGHDDLQKHLFVVRLKDIEDVYDRIDECWKITFDLFGLLRNSDANGIYNLKGDDLFSHLCQLPRIAEALGRQSK